jgi:hypothetical protein
MHEGPRSGEWNASGAMSDSQLTALTRLDDRLTALKERL